jgi:hypothetical protein
MARSVKGLGDPVGSPVGVVGRWAHHSWRLETTSGAFAVKEVVPASNDWWIERQNEAVRLEQAACAAGSVPIAEPIPVRGSDVLVGTLTVGVRGRSTSIHRADGPNRRARPS